ncbi:MULTISPECIES: hypothetical protein [Myroides]|uniref:GAPS4b N-terminal domain-containing protein n=1 Tax=Myroides pelagicus TaxID=270914 RepID=A0A7K1GQC7_9FLAO|nr:hypothetical protein [Myroides pelagicus]MTH31061.1 hypothetical protein [Myroides pelagicus]
MNNILPFGNELKDLLSESYITEAFLSKILREKGIIVQNNDKNSSFPILMSLLLSPNEFRLLQERNEEKEQKDKVKTTLYPIIEGVPLVDVCFDLDIHKILDDKLTYTPNYEIIGVPAYAYDKKEKEINVEVIIKTTSNTKGWSSRESNHTASLNIKNNNNNLTVTKKFTSRESEDVIDLILDDFKEKLENNKFLNKDKNIERILFNCFDNINRVAYFYSFTKISSRTLEFIEVTDIHILPDTDLPDDTEEEKIQTSIQEFLNNVNNLSLRGKKLQDHIVIEKEENHAFIQLKSLKLKYKIIKAGYEGTCVIEFEFPGTRNLKNSEFQFNISKIVLTGKDKHNVNKYELIKTINSVLNNHKLEQFEKLKLTSPS